MRDQRIRDPIHNLISFSGEQEEDALLWELLQTRPVQRLRRIKQLGFSDFVYPGATHSRFSHILGAMHMARRMLSVFEKNEIFKQDDLHILMRKAVLSAALLHDVGHGPYSHVFEDVSEEFGHEDNHEAFTLRIIQSEEIKSILEKHGISKETERFFETEPGYSPYSTIISGELDCDRLDFLSRDKYHTGLRSAAIDLEWLFDSMRIEEVPSDPIMGIKEYSFVFLPKGVSVAEEYVLSYSNMYKSVYFHKTTRAVQMMVRDMLMHLKENVSHNDKNLLNNPFFRFLTSPKERDIDKYLLLDDSSVTSLIQMLADGKYGISTKIANRYLHRQLYKCIELPTRAGGQLKRALTAKFVDALKEESVESFHDIPPVKSIKQFDVINENFLKNILVKKDGEYLALGDVSATVGAISYAKPRLYFYTEKDRNKALKILKKCNTT